MQGTMKGFNTAVIKNGEELFALALKIKKQDDRCQLYYLQPVVLFDLLQILLSRLAKITQRATIEGESYQSNLMASSEALVTNIPQIDMTELQQPDSARRIASLTLKPGDTHFSIIAVLQNESIEVLTLDDTQVGMMLVGIQQALHNSGDEKLLTHINSHLDHLVLYATDMTGIPRIDYQQFEYPEWKHTLFSHHLAVLYCFATEQGEKILSGAVIKTSVEHRSEREVSIARLLAERCPKLKAFSDKYPMTQVMTRVIPAPQGKIASLDDCLLPLRTFCQEMQMNQGSSTLQ
ncbi:MULTISPECIES: YjeJ family protein [Leclercia]|uniref:YjeJ family protein n=1 Tax=Leclercia TaxID=83654 RepID=UPI0021CE22A5|nr:MULTISPECIES: YjeJ family protein [Leclercia]MCU6681690.1 YjeJ family protein [Leclercia tamurae]